MRSELARGDRISLVRKGRHVALHGSIEVDAPLVCQPEERGRGERLGDAVDPEQVNTAVGSMDEMRKATQVFARVLQTTETAGASANGPAAGKPLGK